MLRVATIKTINYKRKQTNNFFIIIKIQTVSAPKGLFIFKM